MIKYWIDIDFKGDLSCQAMKVDWDMAHIREKECEQENSLDKKKSLCVNKQLQLEFFE